MKFRILTSLAVAAVLALGVSAPAFASQSYTGALSDNSCAPGGSVQFTSDNTGEPDGTPGTYSLSGGPSALGAPVINVAAYVTHSIKVGSHSHLTFSVRVPTTAQPGSTYTLSVRAGKFSDTQSIKIVGVPASASAGANLTWLWITIAVVVLLALFLILFFARRRRGDTAATA